MTIHKPVLLRETIKGLKLKKGAIVVDATLGGGSHSLAILKKILPGGKLIAIDRDQEAIDRFRERVRSSRIKLEEGSLELVHRNFSALGEVLFAHGLSEVDAILADLGLSSDQLEDFHRGFSFQTDGMLDMRMDQTRGITAQEVVNTYDLEDLVRMIEKYGQERYARRIARGIIRSREKKPIERTLELAEIVKNSVPENYKHHKTHYATRTFQALRMEVNEELDSLGKFLNDAIGLLRSGGRIAAISFHSGEDSLVKNIFRENARGCICPPNFPLCRCGKESLVRIIGSKPIVPGKKELRDNPRSRSAKLRIAEKI